MSTFFSCESLDLGHLTPEYPSLFPTNGEGIRSRPLPGVKCRICEANGQEVWVTPGLPCPECRTAATDALHPCHDDDDGR